MAISEAGGWAVGETLEDLAEYAMAQGAEGYDVHEVRLCRCSACGGHVFGVRGDLEQHAAQRSCRGCGAVHFIADSGNYWNETSSGIGIMVCECDGDGDEEDFNIAVGYSLYEDDDDSGIRAIAVTSRCVACGRLGYWDDWMIRGGETHLLDLA